MRPSDHPTDHAPRRRRIPVSVALALSILVVPAVALASHQFNDVPTGASYHDEVERLVGAGITTGCGGGNYCPGNAVTRGQMAQFLTRGLGATEDASGQILMSDADTDYVAAVAVPAGSIPGGTGFVTVTGNLTVFDTHGECPCLVEFWLENADTGTAASPSGWMTVAGPPVNGIVANSGSISWTFDVPSGSETVFGLAADIQKPVATVTGGASTQGFSGSTLQGAMTAEYAPFGTVND